MIATAHTPSSSYLLPSTSVSDISSIHEDEVTLIDLLGAEEIPVELGLVFLPPKIQWLYQAYQVVQKEVQSHSPEFTVGFALGTNSRERGNRYWMPTPYPQPHMRQRKVYMADKQKQRYKNIYNPDLDHHYDLYLRPCSYLRNLCSYPY